MKWRRWGAVALILWIATRFIAFEEKGMVDPEGRTIWVVDHGYHAGLLLTREDVAQYGGQMSQHWLAVFPQAHWFEFGWGDAGFYANTPSFADVTLAIAAHALLVPSESVLHVATGQGHATQAFVHSDRFEIRLSNAGMRRLMASIEEGAADPLLLGAGLYGVSGFFKGTERYHLFQTCNSWVGQRLRAAGVAAAPGPAMFSFGLMADLRMRYRF